MVISCPNCGVGFRLDPAQLGTEGRMVRCSACRHTWFQPPPRPEPQDAPPVPPDFRAMEAEAPVRRQHADWPRDSRRGGRGIGLIAVLIIAALLIAVGAAGYQLRDRIVAELPQLAPVYDTLGIETAAVAPAPGDGLAIRDLGWSQAEAGGLPVLIITGRIANLSEVARPVPGLKAILEDEANREIVSWTFDPEAGEIAVGGSVPFTTRIENPPPEAKNFRTTFVARTQGP
ncbi:MAG: DUF3426 domain-containing protein [Rhodospirillaceae bacterium]|jgi:predicted Zn finger-like uncharacterized protein|nr:DUF3426 domain-containing protein [Rhodospirillaceae bacterium]